MPAIDNHHSGITSIPVMFMQKELCDHWSCSIRTVKRRVRKYRLKPCGFLRANVPLFTEKDVARVAKKEHVKQLKQWRKRHAN